MNIWNTRLPAASGESQEYARRRGRAEEQEQKNEVTSKQQPPQITTPTPRTIEAKPNPPVAPEEEFVDLSDIELPTRIRQYNGLKEKQIRRRNLSISVSEEEYDLLRKGAVRSGMGFSAWARKVLFNSLRRQVPKRPTN